MATPNCPVNANLCVKETKTFSISFQWVIENYRSHIKHNGYSLKSTTVSANPKDPIKWFLIAYPNGNKGHSLGYLSVFVSCEVQEGTKIPVPTSVELGIKNKKDGSIFNKIEVVIYGKCDCKRMEWGRHSLIKTTLLLDSSRGLLINDTLTLHCKIILPCQLTISTGRNSPRKIPQCCLRDNLGCILERKLFSDVKLTAGDKEFNAHKVVLAAMSPVFSAMFSTELKENKEGVVEIIDVDPDVLENLLKFVYTGKIEFENVQLTSGLLVAADKYGIERLKCLCEDKLCGQLTIGSVLELLFLAYLHNANHLKEKAVDFAYSNIMLVRASKSWQALVNKYPQLLDQIFEHYLLREHHGESQLRN